MRVNVLQHAPNEGPGSIQAWCHARDNEMFVYHPGNFGILPTVDETDLLVVLGSQTVLMMILIGSKMNVC